MQVWQFKGNRISSQLHSAGLKLPPSVEHRRGVELHVEPAAGYPGIANQHIFERDSVSTLDNKLERPPAVPGGG